ncbi:hypothetical protein [Methylobacterium oryzisoli]|uniref:hypothetical protein n=1 Tax=Methylobacterium oryzisoli TaxID=3385502 RepID=UPI0038914D8E
MAGAHLVAAMGLGLFLTPAGISAALATEGGLAAYQGAWVLEGRDCAEVYSPTGKGTTFKKPIDIFAPAFVIAGRRLRTPGASCQIKAVRPTGDRQLLVLDCANAVAANEVRTIMAPSNGILKRYYSEQDTTGVGYRRCSR